MIETCCHCGEKRNGHQQVSQTCGACGRPMRYAPESLHFLGKISEELKAITHLGIHFYERHHMSGPGRAMRFGDIQDDPPRYYTYCGAVVHADNDDQMYVFIRDLPQWMQERIEEARQPPSGDAHLPEREKIGGLKQ